MIFVTGGTGLIGSFLLRALRARGLAVRALHRGAVPAGCCAGRGMGGRRPARHRPAARCPYARCDARVPLRRPGFLRAAGRRFAAGRERAGHSGPCGCLPGAAAASGWRTCRRWRRWAGRRPAATADANGALPVTETATWDLGAAHPAYATSKYLGELEVWRGVAEGLSAVIVNPSVVLGPGDWSRSSTRLLRYAHQQHRFYTRGLLNFVDVRDVVAQLLALALDQPELSGERYILSAEAVPLGDFFREAAQAMSRRPPTVAVPDWAAEVIWRLEHARAVLTGARPLITKDTARAGRQPVVYCHAKVQRATGLAFRPLAETLAWCAAELAEKPNHFPGGYRILASSRDCTVLAKIVIIDRRIPQAMATAFADGPLAGYSSRIYLVR